jgi:transcription termination factor Rho
LELNTGVTLNVEITSIADMQKHFKINKNEERFENWKSKAKIPLHELEKLNRILPSQDLTEKIRKFKEMNVSENDSVDNPLYKSGKSILISNMPKTATDLYSLLKDAIAKKVSKKHPDKDRTVLIIDNRTSIFETSDYRDAAEKLATYCASSPFPEIWFYTGYYSDMNGNNAEFSFAPLKVTEQQQDVLRRMAATAEVDEHGKLVW